MSQCGWFEEEINLSPLPETEPQFLGHVARILVNILTEALWIFLRTCLT